MQYQGVLTKNWFAFPITSVLTPPDPRSSVFIRGKFLPFRSRRSRRSHQSCLTIWLNSSTCKFGGQSFQLCRQHTIKSHFSGSCRWSLKLRLSYSNSILKCCHRPGATSTLASQSGNPACIDSITNPSCFPVDKRSVTGQADREMGKLLLASSKAIRDRTRLLRVFNVVTSAVGPCVAGTPSR